MREKIRLLYILAKADFRKRFIGSYFGVVWMFIQPVVSVLIYYCVFQLGFRSNPVNDVPFVLWLIPGIVPWFFFNDALQNGVSAFVAYRHLVKKMVFDVSLIPVIKVAASLFVHIIFLAITVIVFLCLGQKPSIWWIQSLYYVFCNIVLIAGIVYLTASVNVFVKDMGQLVNVLLQFGFWLAPIMYTFEMMPTGFQTFLKLNPFCYIVEGFRDCFIYHRGILENSYGTGYFWIVTLIVFGIGIFVFKRLETHFADVL